MTTSSGTKFAYRRYAHPLDKPIKGDQSTHGVSPSSDAIGGYYGMGWYEYFQDRNTSEQYQVSCHDGVYSSKEAFTWEDCSWRDRCRQSIFRRTSNEVENGAVEVRISTNEWSLMKGFAHTDWLDDVFRDTVYSETPYPGQKQVRADWSIESGAIGHHKGVPVVVDPTKEDDLPPRPEN